MNVSEHDNVGVLQAVKLLDDDLIRTRGPFHSRQIVVARVAGNVEPERLAAGSANDPYLRRGIHLAGLGIRKRSDHWIESARIIHQVKLFDAFGIELPISDLLAVRAPAKTVATKQLFFVNPIKGAVDDVTRAVIG